LSSPPFVLLFFFLQRSMVLSPYVFSPKSKNHFFARGARFSHPFPFPPKAHRNQFFGTFCPAVMGLLGQSQFFFIPPPKGFLKSFNSLTEWGRPFFPPFFLGRIRPRRCATPLPFVVHQISSCLLFLATGAFVRTTLLSRTRPQNPPASPAVPPHTEQKETFFFFADNQFQYIFRCPF